MIRYFKNFAALTLLLLASVANAQSDLPRHLEGYMDAHARIYSFSGAVLLKKGDRILLRRAYGLADRIWNVPQRIDARFRVASTSKPFTAVAIMKLVEERRLSLDDTLERYLPGFPSGDRITIRMMLNHTSGLPRGHDMDVAINIFMTHGQALPILKAKPLEFEPGTKTGYSNTAYLLLSFIIEKVSGNSYATFLEERVLRPAGLRNTGVYDANRLIPLMTGHYRRKNLTPGTPFENPFPANYNMFQGHGNLYSTVDDLAHFFNLFRGTGLLSRASVSAMMTKERENSPFALGLEVTTIGGHRAFGHGGDYSGARVRPYIFPEHDLTAIVISNNDADADGILRALAAMVFGQNVELPVVRTRTQIDAGILPKYAGVYGVSDIRVRDGKLMLGDEELVPESRTKFFGEEDPNYTYDFVVGPDGVATAIRFSRYGVSRTILRTPATS